MHAAGWVSIRRIQVLRGRVRFSVEVCSEYYPKTILKQENNFKI